MLRHEIFTCPITGSSYISEFLDLRIYGKEYFGAFLDLRLEKREKNGPTNSRIVEELKKEELLRFKNILKKIYNEY